MKIWMDFENRFNIVNSTLPNYWWRSSLQNMHALLEQYSTTSINIEKGHSCKGIKVSDLCKNKNLEIGPGTRHQEPLLTSTPRTACINPWTSKAPLLLAAHGPQDPDMQQHTQQLAANELVKVIGADQCVAEKSLVPDVADQLQRTWMYHSLAPRSSGGASC